MASHERGRSVCATGRDASGIETVTKIAVSVAEAATLSGLSRSTLYELFRSGKLKPRKNGSRTLVLVEDLEACMRGLPVAYPTKEAA